MAESPRPGSEACCAASDGTFDLAILGGGSAAFAAARRATALGARVLMVNDGLLGGTCVNVGCVPSKTLIRAAENRHLHGVSRFSGVDAHACAVDYGEIAADRDALVSRLRRAKYADVLATLARVELVEGRGRLTGPGEIEVGATRYRARRILIATGARPARPPIPGLEDPEIWDSTAALASKRLPRRLVVLGGRYVALELGQAFARLGSEVVIVQRSARLLPEEDVDVSETLTGLLRQEGLEVRTGRTLTRVAHEGGEFRVEARARGRDEAIAGDAVIAALGRIPNTEGLGLERVGVGLASDGRVRVGDDLQTNVAGIYAAGDVIGEPAYVYAAAYEGALAAENALGDEPRSRDYTGIPWVIFTDPQVAGVGLGEREAAEAGLDVEVSVLPLAEVPRALAAHDTRGFVKLLRARGEDRLVGARIVAPEGGEQIAEASLMVRFGLPISQVARHFHAYLTQSEAIKLAAIGFDTDVAKLSCCAD